MGTRETLRYRARHTTTAGDNREKKALKCVERAQKGVMMGDGDGDLLGPRKRGRVSLSSELEVRSGTSGGSGSRGLRGVGLRALLVEEEG
jgi:hypothetical protein